MDGGWCVVDGAWWMVMHRIKESAVSVDIFPGVTLPKLELTDLRRMERSLRGGLQPRLHMVYYPGRAILLKDLVRKLWSLGFSEVLSHSPVNL